MFGYGVHSLAWCNSSCGPLASFLAPTAPNPKASKLECSVQSRTNMITQLLGEHDSIKGIKSNPYLFSSPGQCSHRVCQHLNPPVVILRKAAWECGERSIRWTNAIVHQINIAALLLEPLQRHCEQRSLQRAHG